MNLFLSPTKKLIVKNISFNILQQIVNTIYTFIIPPLIIIHYGSVMNGMIASIKQFLVYLNLVEAGIGGAAIVALYKPLVENNIAVRNLILSATCKFYNRVGLIFLICLVIFSFGFSFLVNKEVATYFSIAMVLLIGIINLIDFVFIGKYQVLLIADARNYVISSIKIIGILIDLLILYTLISNNFNLIIAQATSTSAYFIRYLLIYLYTHHKYDELNFSLKASLNIIQQKSAILIHQLSGAIVHNSPIILITIFLNLTAASIYSIYALVFLAIKVFLFAFANGAQSIMGKKLISNNQKDIQSFFYKFENVYLAILGWFYSCAYILAFSFIALYTKNMHDANYLHPDLILLFVIVGIADNIRVPSNCLVSAVGHFQQTKNRAILEMSINLLASIIGIYYLGLSGVLIGSLFSYTYRTLDFIIYGRKYILQDKYIVSIIQILLLILNIIIAIWLINHLYLPSIVNNYFEWIKQASAVSFMCAIIFCIHYKINLLLAKKIKDRHESM